MLLLWLNPIWTPRLATLQPMGRMPLTNYLMQSLVGTFIFYPFGLGLFQDIGPAAVVAAAFVIWALQCLLSAWWFRRHAFGPMEALWRALTYGHWPGKRARQPAAA